MKVRGGRNRNEEACEKRTRTDDKNDGEKVTNKLRWNEIERKE